MRDASRDREAVITGVGLASCLGEGPDAHWEALQNFRPAIDEASFAPFPVHPIVKLEYDRQIPKKGDQRQMEPWQRIGTYAAGLALDHAGVAGDAALLERMDMIVAAGGGERDCAVDAAILSDLDAEGGPARLLNDRLLGDLRPTLFLAQLSNLLAGNISIVHGVVGSSRTFMGEEQAGVDAVRIACARIAAGQGDLFLIGGSYNAQRDDVVLHFELGRKLLRAPFASVQARQARGGGLTVGSVGCFLVIEARGHAAERGALARAHVAAVASDRCARAPGQATRNAARQWEAMRHHVGPRAAALSGASGLPEITAEEFSFLAGLGLPSRATTTAFGASMEPSFLANLALAAIALERGELFPPLDPSEAPTAGPLEQVLVTSWGHWRGEGMAVVTAP
jgi:3-oxoacyl-[acyl-carrier-protein] synthase II